MGLGDARPGSAERPTKLTLCAPTLATYGLGWGQGCRWAEASRHYSSALEGLSRVTGLRKELLPAWLALGHVLALMAQGNAHRKIASTRMAYIYISIYVHHLIELVVLFIIISSYVNGRCVVHEMALKCFPNHHQVAISTARGRTPSSSSACTPKARLHSCTLSI